MNQSIPEHICEKFYNMTNEEFCEWLLYNGWEQALEEALEPLREAVIEEQIELEK